jgi:hypothetical protein
MCSSVCGHAQRKSIEVTLSIVSKMLEEKKLCEIFLQNFGVLMLFCFNTLHDGLTGE